jgi:hypothetical protein
MSQDFEVVWSGRDSLIPDRPERWDSRYASMPTYDIDDGEKGTSNANKRKYTRTGKFKGICSRTDPNAKQYVPTRKDGSGGGK